MKLLRSILEASKIGSKIEWINDWLHDHDSVAHKVLDLVKQDKMKEAVAAILEADPKLEKHYAEAIADQLFYEHC